MSSSVREQVAAHLAPMIPTGWAVKPHTVKQLNTLSKTTLFIEHTTIDVLDAAPVGHVQNTVMLTVVSPRTNYEAAEDDLDTDVLTLVTALDESDRLGFVKAEKREVVDTYLAWAVTVTAITEKES